MGGIRRRWIAIQGSGYTAYQRKVRAYTPIHYIPIDDPVSSSIARDVSVNLLPGTPTAVTFGQPGNTGDTSGSFNGSSSKITLNAGFTTSLWTPALFTVSLWFKVASAAFWTDGTSHVLLEILADASNYVSIRKLADNTLNFRLREGGSSHSFDQTTTSTGWNHVALVRNASNQALAYFNGTQVGSTSGSVGTWAGAITAKALGQGTVGYFVGWLSDFAVFNAALTQPQVADLATAPS